MGEGQSKGLSQAEAKQLASKTNYSKEEIQQLYAEFKAMDKDGSGELDKEEFKTLFRARMKGSSDEQLESLFTQFDTDKSGTISFKELATALSVVGKGTAEEKLGYMFDMYDKDKSGTLTRNEVEAILKQMRSVAVSMGRTDEKTSNFVEALLNKLDKNRDGVISRSEWVQEGARTPSLLLFLGLN